MAEERYTSCSVNRLPNKTWKARLGYKDADGKWKSIYKNFDASLGKKEAKAKAQEWKDEMNRQAGLYPSVRKGESVAEVVEDFIGFQLRNKIIEKSTYSNQMAYFNKHIKDSIGTYDFASLDYVAIDNWLTELNSKGLKQATIGSIYAVVAKTYSYKQFIGAIKENPFDRIKKPKKSSPKVTYLDQKTMDNLIDLTEGDGSPTATVIRLALYGGLRRGEICGLRWSDIDFRSGFISVNTAIGGSAGSTYTKQPKNESSARTFKMNEPLRRALRERREWVEKEQGTIAENWFVVGKTINYMSPSQASRNTKKFFEEFSIYDHYGNLATLHGLRHNFATQAVGSKQVDIAVLSRMMGHANTSMTLNTYSTDMATGMEKGAEALTEIFQGDKNGNAERR